jgi:protease I
MESRRNLALEGKRVAVLMTDGVEQVEYTAPRAFLEQHDSYGERENEPGTKS